MPSKKTASKTTKKASAPAPRQPFVPFIPPGMRFQQGSYDVYECTCCSKPNIGYCLTPGCTNNFIQH